MSCRVFQRLGKVVGSCNYGIIANHNRTASAAFIYFSSFDSAIF
jgi:hypothetical protein